MLLLLADPETSKFSQQIKGNQRMVLSDELILALHFSYSADVF